MMQYSSDILFLPFVVFVRVVSSWMFGHKHHGGHAMSRRHCYQMVPLFQSQKPIRQYVVVAAASVEWDKLALPEYHPWFPQASQWIARWKRYGTKIVNVVRHISPTTWMMWMMEHLLCHDDFDFVASGNELRYYAVDLTFETLHHYFLCSSRRSLLQYPLLAYYFRAAFFLLAMICCCCCVHRLSMDVDEELSA